MSTIRQPRRLPLVQLDVFSSRPLEGNPLAVFTDGLGLSDGEMQALAREMNLSETTFVLPRDPETERRQGVRVRIFTVQEELPFAGHPTFGEMTQVAPSFGPRHEREAVAAATGLHLDDIEPGLPVQTVSTGLPFTIVPVRSLGAM